LKNITKSKLYLKNKVKENLKVINQEHF